MLPRLLDLSLVALLLLPGPASADPRWTVDGVPVCTAPRSQGRPVIVHDGAGGAFIAWSDRRNGREDIFAQHVLASGIVDPKWPDDGLPVCTAPGMQRNHRMIADDSGGAIIVWEDERLSDFVGSADIYAQRILRSGKVDPGWPKDGRAICVALEDQELPELTTDGAGGAVIVWVDYRDGASDVYAQRIVAAGTMDPAWPVDGLAVCKAPAGQSELRIVKDEAGGAIVAWTDDRDELSDIYSHHVLATGVVDPAWPANGRAVCTASELQGNPALVEDGKGGAVVAWADARTGSFPYSNYFDIYAQHVLASGTLDPAWPAEGQTICMAQRGQSRPEIVSDGAAGAIVAWIDGRGFRKAIYGQRVLVSGTVDFAWPPDGAALCTAAPQFGFAITGDGLGGAMLAWEDQRGAGSDVYAQHVRASGRIDDDWSANGDAVCAFGGDQFDVAIAGVGPSRAIVVWRDHRNGEGDIYARRVLGRGVLVPPRAGQNGTLRVNAPSPSGAQGRLTVSFDLPAAQPVTVELFDLAGRAVRTLAAHQALAAGTHILAWDGANGEGSMLKRGIYLVRVNAGSESVTGKLLKLH